ncbi:MAG TPA: hypothetical protein PLX88_06220 [Syntrophorhabdaceae bacterium]|nr:hypothetical protein [Syntrophorhabdaceae bacterium]MDI9560002.1 hypothetical protein [Pseudomonadota bacterium]MBP8699457.1 hypothetical protein [Syntrophorhabdaceae bacterium]HNZ59413.1 hypothetical protein [Syntrophorhabdaceae bacterium]HOG40386.1 hypothetical protein [Syntrophorhabdaceae bacterium]
MEKAEGWRVSKSEGVKDSRIQGVEWFSWYLFSKPKSEGVEGRRITQPEKPES